MASGLDVVALFCSHGSETASRSAIYLKMDLRACRKCTLCPKSLCSAAIFVIAEQPAVTSMIGKGDSANVAVGIHGCTSRGPLRYLELRRFRGQYLAFQSKGVLQKCFTDRLTIQFTGAHLTHSDSATGSSEAVPACNSTIPFGHARRIMGFEESASSGHAFNLLNSIPL